MTQYPKRSSKKKDLLKNGTKAPLRSVEEIQKEYSYLCCQLGGISHQIEVFKASARQMNQDMARVYAEGEEARAAAAQKELFKAVTDAKEPHLANETKDHVEVQENQNVQ